MTTTVDQKHLSWDWKWSSVVLAESFIKDEGARRIEQHQIVAFLVKEGHLSEGTSGFTRWLSTFQFYFNLIQTLRSLLLRSWPPLTHEAT